MSELSSNTETIVAVATPPGKGAVGIVKVSGSNLQSLMQGVLGFLPNPRSAHRSSFIDCDNSIIDSGIAIYFPAPHSYTGEHVLELQGHGGIVVMDMLLKRLCTLGARLARPGEFTERAFLNNKLDLTQAEAIADLIESDTEKAARCAQQSIQGEFSKRVKSIQDVLVELRMYIEASIDFVDEDIDFLSDGNIENRLYELLSTIESLKKIAQKGCLLRNGMTVVIAGRPNAGKSSLLNLLAGNETAIVTEWEGTTRDVLRETIQIDGMPLHIIDTAGLRQTENQIEKEGVKRAYLEIEKADRLLYIVDIANPTEDCNLVSTFPNTIKVTKIFNKIDLTGITPKCVDTSEYTEIYMSIKYDKGTDLLINHLKECIGLDQSTEAVFTARRRHLVALDDTENYIHTAVNALGPNIQCDLLAEDLRLAQNTLSTITGEFTTDDLLGVIFSGFCIGK